jgi:hypothetical protein
VTAPHIIRDGQPAGPDDAMNTPWSCSCGATGAYGPDHSDEDFPGTHLGEVARPLLPDLGVGELIEALRRGLPDMATSADAAATELLIRHGYWLSDPELRNPDYLHVEWNDDGQLVMSVAWGALVLASSPTDAVMQLSHFLPDNLEEQVWNWLNPPDTPPGTIIYPSGPLTQHSEAAIAVLRIATTIAGSAPVRLGAEVERLDERARLLVGAALAQMLAGRPR